MIVTIDGVPTEVGASTAQPAPLDVIATIRAIAGSAFENGVMSALVRFVPGLTPSEVRTILAEERAAWEARTATAKRGTVGL